MRIRLNLEATENEGITIRGYTALFLISVLILLVIAIIETVPGYMDADYYYLMGLRIANNQGWSEPVIWNYLNDPQALPHQAFSYWMPLAGIVAGLGMKATNFMNFWGARFGFIIIAGCAVVFTAYLGYTFTKRRWAAILAGLLAIFPGFYFAYLPTTDTFGIYMLLGALFFVLVSRLQIDYRKVPHLTENKEILLKQSKLVSKKNLTPWWVFLLLGLIPGLMHLTRADGLIWFSLALIAIVFKEISLRRELPYGGNQNNILYQFGIPIFFCIIGYAIAISPWFIRNLIHYGHVFPPGMNRTIWLTKYDELFLFPASQLTYEHWLDSGIVSILNSRVWALGRNLLNSFAVQGGIFLLPLIVLGMWLHRKDWRVGLGLLAWLITLLTMTLVFPFQGARGGFFHAGAALQPLFWALVPAGLLGFIKWGSRQRRWDSGRALTVFSSGVVIITILVTSLVTWQRVIGKNISDPNWGRLEVSYHEVDSFLNELPNATDSVIMVNNPPGFSAQTGRKAIVIPDGDIGVSRAAGRFYFARYMVLDENYPQGLKDLYTNPGNRTGLQYLGSLGKMHIFLLEE